MSPRRSWSASAMTGSSTPTPHRPSRAPSAVPAATATGSAARTRQPGQPPTPNYTPRTAATAPCTSKPGAACIPNSPDADDGPTTTPRRSLPEPSSASTSNTYPNPPHAPKRRCGCGLPAPARSTSTPAGEPTCAASTSNTPSGSARTPSDGPPHDCAPPTRPTGGPGSSPPPTPNFGSPDPWSPTSDCPGRNPPNQTNSPPLRVRRGFRRLTATLGTPANPPKPSKAGPGRPKGTRRSPRTRHPAIKKTA